MTLDEIRALVNKEALYFWQDPRQTVFISYVVPFAPINEKGRRKFIDYLLLRLEQEPKIKENKAQVKINISNFSKNKLISLIASQSSSDIIQNKNYRGVEELFNSLVLYPIITHLQDNPRETKRRTLTLIIDETIQIKEETSIVSIEL